MGHGIFGWDLPPGVSASDIPGNRPEDEAWELLENAFYVANVSDDLWGKFVTKKLDDKLSDFITKAIEYGMEIGHREAEDCRLENKYYETHFIKETLEKAGVNQDTIDKVEKILGGDYETP